MTGIDWALLGLLFISAVGLLWPFLFYPLILRLLPSRAVRVDAAHRSSASLLFCAFNEGAAMPGKIANLAMLKARHPDLEILAFDDGSSDDTAAQLAARPDIVTLVRGGGRSGKAHGMKQLAAMARGEVLIFTDANVSLAEDAVERLLAYYADPQVGGVLGSLHYSGADQSTTASVGSLYWRMEEALKDAESATGNVMGADGSIFSVRRALYPDFPDSVLDDLTVSMAMVFAGRRLVKARDVHAYEALVSERADEYRRKVRIAARAWHTRRHLLPGLRAMSFVDRFKFASRKTVRWFGALFLAGGALAAIGLAARFSPLAGILLAAAIIAFLWAGSHARRGPLAALTDILWAYVATLHGVMRAMRGDSFTLWNPAKSR